MTGEAKWLFVRERQHARVLDSRWFWPGVAFSQHISHSTFDKWQPNWPSIVASAAQAVMRDVLPWPHFFSTGLSD